MTRSSGPVLRILQADRASPWARTTRPLGLVVRASWARTATSWNSYYEAFGFVLRGSWARTTRCLFGLSRKIGGHGTRTTKSGVRTTSRAGGPWGRTTSGTGVPRGRPGASRGLLRVSRGFVGPQRSYEGVFPRFPPTSPGASCEISQCLSKSLLRISWGHLGVPGREDPWSVGMGAVVAIPVGQRAIVNQIALCAIPRRFAFPIGFASVAKSELVRTSPVHGHGLFYGFRNNLQRAWAFARVLLLLLNFARKIICPLGTGKLQKQ